MKFCGIFQSICAKVMKLKLVWLRKHIKKMKLTHHSQQIRWVKSARDHSANSSIVFEHQKTRNEFCLTRITTNWAEIFQVSKTWRQELSSCFLICNRPCRCMVAMTWQQTERMILNQILNKNSKYHFERSDHRSIGRCYAPQNCI